MIKVITRGQDKFYFDHLMQRRGNAISVFLTQKTVFTNRPILSFFHTLIAWAFILYFLVNLGDVLTGYLNDFHFLRTGIVGNIYRLFVDIFSVLAAISVLGFLVRRFILKSSKLKIRENVLLQNITITGILRDSMIVALFIFFHVGFRFIGETFYLALEGTDT